MAESFKQNMLASGERLKEILSKEGDSLKRPSDVYGKMIENTVSEMNPMVRVFFGNLPEQQRDEFYQQVLADVAACDVALGEVVEIFDKPDKATLQLMCVSIESYFEDEVFRDDKYELVRVAGRDCTRF